MSHTFPTPLDGAADGESVSSFRRRCMANSFCWPTIGADTGSMATTGGVSASRCAPQC